MMQVTSAQERPGARKWLVHGRCRNRSTGGAPRTSRHAANWIWAAQASQCADKSARGCPNVVDELPGDHPLSSWRVMLPTKCADRVFKPGADTAISRSGKPSATPKAAPAYDGRVTIKNQRSNASVGRRS